MIRAAALLSLILVAAGSDAQQLYRYKDENGQWQFSDRPPADATTEGETKTLETAVVRPTVTIGRRELKDGYEIVARNQFAGVVHLQMELIDAFNLAADTPTSGEALLPPQSETVVMQVMAAQADSRPGFRLRANWLPGDPASPHRAPEPYRFPFAAGKSLPISQAYPDQVTHTTVGSRHAVDIVAPVGTAIYAAREGTVLEVAHDSFSGGTDIANLPKANFVRIMHDDATMSVYAHLSWDSIRVRPGQEVARGEFIASSGNTGFSSGPHLHFVVQRNNGEELESVPVRFSGPGGKAVVPKSGRYFSAP